jgi:hypothetical protein
MRNLHGWRVQLEIVLRAEIARFPPSATGRKGTCPGRLLGVNVMTRFSFLKTLRKIIATPPRYVSRYDRVDANLLPLISQRYV